MINKDGFVVLPHYMQQDYLETVKIAKHCENYLTLLRYFDLKEVVEFISYVIKNNMAARKMCIERHFETLNEVNMKNIKIYYIQLLQNILNGAWSSVYTHFKQNRKPRIFENNKIDPKGNKITKTRSVGPGTSVSVERTNNLLGAPLSRLRSEQVLPTPPEVPKPAGTSGAYITTKDAYTLTDGPTIFISNEIEKIAKFCIQQANIPSAVMDEINKKIEFNNVINEKIYFIESEIEIIREKNEKAVKNSVSQRHQGMSVQGRNKSSKDSKKINKECNEEKESKGEISKLTTELNSLRAMIRFATLNDTFIPNKKMHMDKWAEDVDTKGAFTSNVDENTVCNIMALKGVENSWKVLLMMGIGVFINHDNIAYTEIMKKLADEQKLYVIIATSDYIYGTNYQFCHGYLSKDLDLTQEKIVQAMGRIGRNNIQQNYTLRFRDDSQILKLFTSETEKPEIINMNILFNGKKVNLIDNKYVEVTEDDADLDEEDILYEDDESIEEEEQEIDEV
jgi:hypothetical protein